MNITVVVLHYENIKDTRECLDSLKKYLDDTKNNINVVVVDNGSIKEKTAAIEKEYLNDKIHFIESGENLGFAKGNNIGFHYAKYELHSDIIILANNDLIFEQVDFMDQIEKDMTENHIDVAGPRIISLVDHKNQNPVPYVHPDLASVKKRIFKLQVLRMMCYFGVDKFFQSIFSKKYSADVKSDNYQLHGACLIMANNYVKNYDGLYPKTFMYMEEGIRCNAVSPGGVVTDIPLVMPPSDEFGFGRTSKLLEFSGELAMPEDLADAILFLASDQSRYVNGEELKCDGGWTCF